MRKSRKIVGNPLKDSLNTSNASPSTGEVTIENFNSKLSYALNYYQRTYDIKDSRSFLLKFKPEVSKYINSLSENQFHEYKTLGFTCKFLIDNKLSQDFDKETNDWINEKIAEIKELKELKKTSNDYETKKHDVQKAIMTQIREKMGEIDNHFEEYFDFIWKGIDKKDFDIIEYIKGCNFSPLHVRKIYNLYIPHLNDLKTALNCKKINKYNNDGLVGEVDEEADLKEGYKFLGDRKLKKIITFYEQELQKLDTYVKLNSNRRKKETKRPSIKKLVSKVKYLKQSEELGITSLSPEKIVGNNYVFLYNVKYRKLIMLISNDISGFSIKGTTIYNYKEATSFTKTLRENVELSTFAKSSKTATIEAFDKLKTKASPANGRINGDTIILSTFK